MKTREGDALWLDSVVCQKRATGPEDTHGSQIKDREAWRRLRKPLPTGRRRGVKSALEIMLGDPGAGITFTWMRSAVDPWME